MISWQKVIISQTVTTTGSVNSRPIRASYAEEVIGVKIKIESSTTPEVQVGYQAINSGQGDASRVGNAEDVAKNGAEWFTPETGAVIIQSITSGVKGDGHTLMPTDWYRLVVTGINDNASAVVSVWVAVEDNGSC